MDVREDGGLSDDYKLKLNSYDLAVDIELADAIQRLRFEHPTCAPSSWRRSRSASSGRRQHHDAARSSHAPSQLLQIHERDASGDRGCEPALGPEVSRRPERHLRGRRYELALACDEILLVDDGNSAVSLPEAPLLGVLPGTGGLTHR